MPGSQWSNLTYTYLLAATDGMVAGSGGSRRGSYDTELQSDDSSSTNASSGMGGLVTPKGRSPKVNTTPPKRKDLMSKFPVDVLCSFCFSLI